GLDGAERGRLQAPDRRCRGGMRRSSMIPTREVVSTPTPNLDIGLTLGQPASTLVRGGDCLFGSGLLALDPATGARLHGTAASETRQILANLKDMLEGAGSSLDKVVKVNVLLASMLEAPNVNEVFE